MRRRRRETLACATVGISDRRPQVEAGGARLLARARLGGGRRLERAFAADGGDEGRRRAGERLLLFYQKSGSRLRRRRVSSRRRFRFRPGIAGIARFFFRGEAGSRLADPDSSADSQLKFVRERRRRVVRGASAVAVLTKTREIG